MVKGVKPHLSGIQEFGAAAYVKDLAAGKLDPRATKGRFVGYDSESKGYRIYWAEKGSVSVERNVVFNPEDMLTEEVVIPDLLTEGEQEKIIQKLPGEQPKDVNKDDEDRNKIDLPPILPPAEQRNDVAEDALQLSKRARATETLPVPEPNTGRGFRSRHKPGAYARMHEGLAPLDANVAKIDTGVDTRNVFDTSDVLYTPDAQFRDVFDASDVLYTPDAPI